MAAIKSVLRILATGVIWVFILSLQVGEKRLFDHASELLVENPIVAFADEQFGNTWELVQEGWQETVGSQDSGSNILKL